MQKYITHQDISVPSIGLKRRQMPQASFSMTSITIPPPNCGVPSNAPPTPTTPSTGIMPSLTRENLAVRLRQNWLAKHPVDPPLPTAPADDSLTSLNWLQNLNIMKMASPTPPASPQPSQDLLQQQQPQYTPSTQVNPNAVLNMATNSPFPPAVQVKQEPGLNNVGVAPPRITPFMDMVAPSTSPGLDKIDYKTNPCVKPPYSYATLICMAMKETKKNKITLAGIYNWITENFLYYKVADPSWQNSIRHNLSLNKCFQKVPRRKDEPGKGGFWRINPEYEDMFINGIFKKRRGSVTTSRDVLTSPSPLKRMRREMEDSSDSSNGGSSPPRPAKMAHVEVKKEPAADMLEDGIEFNWNSILSQDIEIGGVKVKTEAIIDGEQDAASPIIEMSPPPSEGSNHNDDIALEDIFNNADFGEALDEPLDFTTGGPLDLSISGMSLKAPTWWEDSLNSGQRLEDPDSGLHTPIAQSPVPDTEYAHPWAEDKTELDNAIACFDTDFANLIDMDNMPSPNMSTISPDS